ncbi:MAG: secretin N-terminal domain-containing protein [Methyloglobulus sp.]
MMKKISQMKLIINLKGFIFAAIWLAFFVLHAPLCSAAKPNNFKSDLISISLKETNITELFEMLSRQNKVNVLLAKGVEGVISVNLYDITVEEAIYAIAEAAGYAVERLKNGYLIALRDTAGKTIANGFKEVRTYKIQYSDAKNVSAILKNYLSRYGRIDLLEDRQILVVEDLPEFVSHIDQILAQLDQEPSQILIEAKIFTITLDDTQKFGLDWTKTFNAGGGQGNAGVENLGKQALNLGIGAAAGPPGLFFNYLNKNVEVQLNFLSKKNKVRALSTPKLLALDHQEAQVIIGDRRGYKTTTTINQVTTENVQFLESGVILNVTPNIDRFGRIMMEIHPEVSSSSINKDSGAPDLKTTEVTTRLLVEDGQTIFIGGLMKNDLSNNHQGVPVLEDIPFLGYLFAKEEDLSVNTETIVLIKPQIIRPHNMTLITSPGSQVEKYIDTAREKSKKIDNYFKKNYMFRSQ